MTHLRNQRGFSMVELLVGAAVALIGLYASLNMAIYALHANQERRDAIAAEQYAEHVLSTIQAEAVFWTDVLPPQVGWYLFRLPAFAQGATTGWQLVPGVDQADDKRVGRMGAGLFQHALHRWRSGCTTAASALRSRRSAASATAASGA